MNSIILAQNVQFMYEHALAKLEMRCGFNLQDLDCDEFNPWFLRGELDGQTPVFLERCAYPAEVDGKPSVYAQLIKPAYKGGKFNLTRSENQYLTHWIYPYKGKFHPRMIRAILNILGARQGSTVLDPFVGSGTCALESQLLGLNFLGVDASPLCVKLTRVKTMAWEHVDQIRSVVGKILAQSGSLDSDSLRGFRVTGIVRDFLDIARLLTASDVKRRGREFDKSIRRNLPRMLHSVEDMALAKSEFGLQLGRVTVTEGDARLLLQAGISNESVDFIVTSPPYSIALDYVANDEAALEELGVDRERLRQDMVGVRGETHRERLRLYNADMQTCFSEMHRVLKPGGRCVVIIGDATVGGIEKTTTKEMVKWAADRGLEIERDMPKIVYGLYSVVVEERVLFFRKV